jgi:predicted enzyme related to lactoylglutathione lyase
MLDRSDYPAGVPCWIDSAQPDPQAAARFYGGLFGWEFEDRVPADVPGQYFIASLDGGVVGAIGSERDGAPPAPVWSTYIAVDSADETADRVQRAGGSVLAQPFDVLDAGRMAVFADPQGAVFSVWQPGRRKGAQVVNVPGSWNWSNLNTRDPEGAKDFYAAVFGWEASTVSFGEHHATMWRRPGYADALEEIDPGIRERHAGGGAPEGFSDAVGWMLEMNGDQFPDDVPAHWAVTFAVDGTDAVADRAAELGGTVLTAPVDAGPTRLAVLRDPQGAVFSVSTYAPAE